MKTLKGLKLVGLLLKHCVLLNSYSITHVYRYVTGTKKGEIALQLGYDTHCYVEFEKIAAAVGDAYGQNVQKLWVNNEPHRTVCYFQMDVETSPYFIAMNGYWELTAEL